VTRAASPAAAAVDGKYPSPAPGVPEAYEKLPPPFTSVRGVPGRGGRVTVLHQVANTPPAPRDQNQYWQELDRRLGVTYEPTLIPLSAYNERFTVAIASGDLPDLAFLSNSGDQLRAIQQGAFTDLTTYLTGDALGEFPNLALMPPQLWRNVAVRGKIHGVPGARFLAGAPLMWRLDWAEKFGLPRPANADQFARLMNDFTRGDPDGNGIADSYGLGSNGGSLSQVFFQNMFRVPNAWRRNADGSLTNAIETEEYRQGLAFMRRLWEAGVYHPDALTMTLAQAKDGFAAGRVGGYDDALTALSAGLIVNTQRVTPGAKVFGLVPPGHDGGPAVTHNGSGFFYYLGIAARAGRDRERARELLRILDYFCAPFGSEEWRFLNYGLPGAHHTVQPDGGLVRTQAGDQQIGDLVRTANGAFVFYTPGLPGFARDAQRLSQELLAIGIDNPTTGLYSPTSVAKGGELGQLNTDRRTAIVTGREPLGALDAWVRDWRGRGGDQIRKEYEEALRA
jgi:putative aldouronate transport system substrate-binding protein